MKKLISTDFDFQNSLSVSLKRNPTTMKSMMAWETRPSLLWWSCEVLIQRSGPLASCTSLCLFNFFGKNQN